MNEPTEEDLKRSLPADLERAIDNYGPNWGPTPNDARRAYGDFAHEALPAALRRAIAAEARLARWEQFTYCAYCGYEVAIDADGSVIAQHIATCEKHPMRAVEAEVIALSEEVAALKKQVEGHAARIAAQSEALSRAAEKDAALSLLRELEWLGWEPHANESCCPLCMALEIHEKHEAGCKLAALLGKET